jgi:hypothetical protein
VSIAASILAIEGRRTLPQKQCYPELLRLQILEPAPLGLRIMLQNLVSKHRHPVALILRANVGTLTRLIHQLRRIVAIHTAAFVGNNARSRVGLWLNVRHGIDSISRTSEAADGGTGIVKLLAVDLDCE